MYINSCNLSPNGKSLPQLDGCKVKIEDLVGRFYQGSGSLWSPMYYSCPRNLFISEHNEKKMCLYPPDGMWYVGEVLKKSRGMFKWKLYKM